jgi:DNA-binding MarR family transcriptional regulator
VPWGRIGIFSRGIVPWDVHAGTEPQPATSAEPPLSEQDYRDQADFRCALRRFLRYAEEQAMARGVTPQQHLVLVVVRGHSEYPSVSIRELAEALQLRQSSVSLLVDRCVKRGLLERRDDPQDRRRSNLRLTLEGQRLLDEITHANRRQLGSLQEALFSESLRSALQKYVKSGSTS